MSTPLRAEGNPKLTRGGLLINHAVMLGVVLGVISSVLVAFVFPINVPSFSHVDIWITNCDFYNDGAPINMLEPQELSVAKVPEDAVFLHVQPDLRLQQMVGFGAGLLHSSAIVLHNLKLRAPQTYHEVMQRLFSKDSGAGINFVRIPLGSSDFSLVATTYDEVKYDYGLTHFALDNQTLIAAEVLKDALAINPDITVMLSPWTPPSWLKAWDNLYGIDNANTLIDSDTVYNTYATYLNKSIHAWRAKGIEVQYLTLQNEPNHPAYFPGMYLSAQNSVRLGKLVKALIGNKVKILAWDHNWDTPSYPLQSISEAPEVFVGTAWHCYLGNMTVGQSAVQNVYPHLEQHMTECSSMYDDKKCSPTHSLSGFGWQLSVDMQNTLLKGVAFWSKSSMKSTLALDGNCGPYLENYFADSRPVVTILDNSTSIDEIIFNPDYYTLMHMSKFVAKGSYRVTTNSSVIGYQKTKIIAETFHDLTEDTLTTIVYNTDYFQGANVVVSEGSGRFVYQIPAFAVAIFRWSRGSLKPLPNYSVGRPTYLGAYQI